MLHFGFLERVAAGIFMPKSAGFGHLISGVSQGGYANVRRMLVRVRLLQSSLGFRFGANLRKLIVAVVNLLLKAQHRGCQPSGQERKHKNALERITIASASRLDPCAPEDTKDH